MRRMLSCICVVLLCICSGCSSNNKIAINDLHQIEDTNTSENDVLFSFTTLENIDYNRGCELDNFLFEENKQFKLSEATYLYNYLATEDEYEQGKRIIEDPIEETKSGLADLNMLFKNIDRDEFDLWVIRDLMKEKYYNDMLQWYYVSIMSTSVISFENQQYMKVDRDEFNIHCKFKLLNVGDNGGVASFIHSTDCEEHEKGELCFRYLLNMRGEILYKEEEQFSRDQYSESYEKLYDEMYGKQQRNIFTITKDNKVVFANANLDTILVYE